MLEAELKAARLICRIFIDCCSILSWQVACGMWQMASGMWQVWQGPAIVSICQRQPQTVFLLVIRENKFSCNSRFGFGATRREVKSNLPYALSQTHKGAEEEEDDEEVAAGVGENK